MEVSQNAVLRDILSELIKLRASDVHFSVGNYPTLRIGRELRSLEQRELINQEFMEKLVNFLLTKEQQAKLYRDKEIIIAYDFDKQLRFKVIIFYQRSFLSATLRYIPRQLATLSELGVAEVISQFTTLSSGLVIISGTFGSGRSSTTAALIEEINRTKKKYILTIEDPIEYIFVNNLSIIEQREVGRDTNSFADALKYFQEEDGDVLYLEQMSPSEIIPSVLEIASNSLVVTSMAADTATKTIAAIIDSFTSFDQERVKDLLASSLRAVVCQKMIPRAGGGVKVICEVLLANNSVKSIISSGNINQLEGIIQTSRQEGMISFNQALSEAVKRGEIKPAEALAHAPNAAVLQDLIR